MSSFFSGLFGAKKPPFMGTGRVPTITKQAAEPKADELKRRLALLRRASMTSELTEPKIKRKTLGAGGINV